MKNFYIRQSVGDIIYSLPAIFATGGGAIYTGLPYPTYEALKPLIEIQPGIDGFLHEREGIPPGIINLEDFRYRDDVNRRHLCELFGEVLGVVVDYKNGWLKLPTVKKSGKSYAVINITPRYRDKVYMWWNELHFLAKNTEKKLQFVGDYAEYLTFIKKYGRPQYEYAATPTFLEAAILISNAKYFSGTQSACLAIAEGLGRDYRYERSPFFDNVKTGAKRETILNNRTRKIHFAYSRIQEVIRNFKKK
jgi:hypothetical protein